MSVKSFFKKAGKIGSYVPKKVAKAANYVPKKTAKVTKKMANKGYVGAGLSGAASGAAAGLPFGPIGAGVGAAAGAGLGLFNRHTERKAEKAYKKAGGGKKGTRASEEILEKESRKQSRRAYKNAKVDRKEYMKANKIYGKEAKAFMKKYGDEKYIKNPALNKEQQKLHKNINKQAGKEFGKREHRVPKLHHLEKNKEFQRGQSALKGLLSGKELTGNRGYKQQGKTLEGLLSGKTLTNNPLYQQGQSHLQGLLSGESDAYNNFKAPLMREFNEQIAPEIAERFAGQGASSGLQNQLGTAGVDLQERLGRLRSGLQMQAVPQALQYAQAPGMMQQNALGAGLQHSMAPGQMRQNALQAGLQYATAPSDVQQQRINNAMAQNKYQFGKGTALSELGLGTHPYNATFRAATPPQHPQQPPAWNPQAYTPYQAAPSAGSRFASAAAEGAGQGFGQAAASGAGNIFSGLKNYLSGSGASAQTPGFAGNTFQPTSGAGTPGGFGSMNQLGGFRPAT